MKLEFACRVDIGIRESNDDRALIPGRIANMESCSCEGETPAAAVVCDGCGGYAGGGVAAQKVLSVLERADPETLADPEGLAAALEEARQEVYAKKAELPHYAAMCTTVAGCVFCEDRTLIFHAGDSRVYRYDGASLARMTVDHSVVQSMVDMGQLTEEEARLSPQRNTISRCIGVDCPPPDIYISNSPIGPGEIYLMCSDGLWESLPDRQIKQLLSEGGSLPELADRLVEAALRAGSDDNTSVCLCAYPGGAAAAASTPFVLD